MPFFLFQGLSVVAFSQIVCPLLLRQCRLSIIPLGGSLLCTKANQPVSVYKQFLLESRPYYHHNVVYLFVQLVSKQSWGPKSRATNWKAQEISVMLGEVLCQIYQTWRRWRTSCARRLLTKRILKLFSWRYHELFSIIFIFFQFSTGDRPKICWLRGVETRS